MRTVKVHTSCAAPKFPRKLFDLSASKWSHTAHMESWVTRVMGFLPDNFQLITPFHSWLRVRHGTDRQRPSIHYAPTVSGWDKMGHYAKFRSSTANGMSIHGGGQKFASPGNPFPIGGVLKICFHMALAVGLSILKIWLKSVENFLSYTEHKQISAQIITKTQPPLLSKVKISPVGDWRSTSLEWPWPWPWIRPYGIPSCITYRPLPTY